MPKALSKIQKKISAKRRFKNSPAVHENSRDHQRLTSASMREERMNKMASNRAKAKKPELARLTFFQEAVENRTEPMTEAEIQETIFRCIHRDDDDLAAMAERRGKNPSSTKEDLLRMRVKAEETEFKSGYHMPDLTELENVLRLQRWDGRYESMGLITFTRVVQTKD